MTPFAGTGLSLLLDAALKGTLVLLAASILVLSMRRGSAAARHWVWHLALLAVLALPIVKQFSPLRFAVLPALRSPIVTPAEPQTQTQQTPPNTNVVQRERTDDAKSTSSASTSVSPSASPSPSASLSGNGSVTASNSPSLIMRVLFWAALVWIVVAAALVLRLMFGFLLVRWFALRAYPLYENGWNELNGDLASVVGLKEPAQLLASPHIATPMTWGVARPVVMLPSAAEDWTDERRRVVLLHELAHIRRKDSLTHMFAQFACAIYWFHPLVWKAAARMRAEAERACDDLVLGAGMRASVYADHLLELIRTIGGMRTPAVALPMAQRSTFEGRLLAILEPHLDRTSPRPLAVAGMVLVVGLIVLPLAGLTSNTQLGATPLSTALDQQDTVKPRKRDVKKATQEVARNSAQINSKVSTQLEESINNGDFENIGNDIGELAGEMAAKVMNTPASIAS